MKKVLLLGASGSIGKQTIDIINKHNNLFDLVGFSVGYNVDYIDELLTSFTNIKGVYLIDDNQKQLYQNKYPNIQFYSSKDGFKKFIDHIDFDIAVDSLVGISGLVPAIEILKRNKILCLANKEALVTGGHLINDLLNKGFGKLYPIDSEHVALAKCLSVVDINDVEGLYITASGGALRDVPLDKLQYQTAKEALKHPNWKMGDKITIDCATMMNKGFEIIEAYYLFHFPISKIHVSMHKESLVHSYIKLKDGTYIVDYGKPDMHGPIEYALLEGKFEDNLLRINDLSLLSDCHFYEFDERRYPLTKLAINLINERGSKLVALNAANESAVKLFLLGKINYLDIYKIIKKSVDEIKYIQYPSLEEILSIDEFIKNNIEGMFKL
ncbi:MAG: 1-deoxy-D-xylulose-5-phosphate reductoisomerase [Bacilli bacterium]|nr:1-deoxy-D-xylulose-5-phosphate reductoisomerase [Bacilli bacterium]